MYAGLAPSRALLAATLLVATGCSSDNVLYADSVVVLDDSFDDFEQGSWAEGEVHGAWTTVFDGYGEVAVVGTDSGQGLSLSPMVSTRPEETHAALVATTGTFSDVEIEATITTVAQLRQGEPNVWETGWLLWSYTGNTSFYYVALKTNGWEVGKADPAYPGAQRFIADGRDLTFAVGQATDVRVRQVGATIALWIDGDLIGSWVDSEAPLSGGAVALYTEDAEVLFDDVLVSDVE